MSGSFWLDWAALSISLLNTILLVWLGLTVLLNAEKRSLGVWIACDGLLIGAAFFVSHSVFLGEGVLQRPQGLNFWWHAGWWPVVASPFAWYLLMLWFTGFWDSPQTSLFRRQLPWLVLSVIFTLLLAGLIVFANPLPIFTLDARIDLDTIPSIAGLPLLVWGYPLYILTCVSLALDTLLRPAPSSRLMGDQARQQARPWLVGTTLILLAVSLLVAWVMGWAAQSAGQNRPFLEVYNQLAYPLAWYDLALEILITGATLMLGQAVVTYEIFTGKTLPRRGFQRQWRSTILLAAGVSSVATLALDSRLNPIYTLLLALLAMTFFYALISWQSHVERENSVRQLRPFVTSQRLFERFLSPQQSHDREVDFSIPFGAVCREVLNTQQAALVPLGPFAVLAGPPLRYRSHPESGAPSELPDLTDLIAKLETPHQILPLESHHAAGFVLAVSLWSERGVIGLLLVGPKLGGGVYSEEEIEIARANGERLVDIQASAEVARRLVELQRQRMVESQVLDRQTRRVLHDDVLPRLHAALLTLENIPGSASTSGKEVASLLVEAHRQIADLLHAIPPRTAPEVASLGLIDALRQVVTSELEGAFDDVTWQIAPEVDACLSTLTPLAADVVYYAAREALRNAARHARPAGDGARLTLKVCAVWKEGLALTIEDDGVGVPPLETPSTEANPGTDSTALRKTFYYGQGLALHSTLLAVVGGSLALESLPGSYTRVKLSVPVI